jgi:hypothetical protein
MAFERRYRNVSEIGYYHWKRGYVNASKGQARYTDVNPYDNVIIEITNMHRPIMAAGYGGAFNGFNYPNSVALASNKAYERLMEHLKGDSVALGNALGEWRSSVDMIARRAITIRKAFKKLRAGDPFGAIQALTIPGDTKRKLRETLVRKDYVRPGRKRGHMRVRRDKFVSQEHYLSSMWLELHFGFTPLMGDIHDSIKTLSEPVRNPVKIWGSGSEAVNVWYHSTSNGTVTRTGSIVIRVRSGCEVTINNPNLFLANRMGLINPLGIAWELTPFSFVVDWFTNVGQMVESLTDWAGVTPSKGYTTTICDGKGSYYDISAGGTLNQSYDCVHYEFQRKATVVSPQWAIRNPLGGWKRAATQVSLLVQLFIKPR